MSERTKLYGVVMILLVALIGLSGCSSNEEASTATTSLNGAWTPTDSNVQMSAVVQSGVITILWDSPDAKALYWKGTFPSEPSAEIVSKGDVNAMAKSLMASTARTKSFEFSDGTLSFDVSIAGTTKTVHMTQ